MKINEWLKKAASQLDESGVNTARLDSLLLASYVLKKDKSWILASPDHSINDGDQEELNRLLEKRKSRVPLAYLTNEKDFFGLSFYVDERVMIPRPETEELVEYLIDHAPYKSRVVELGVGSGAISLSVAKNRKDLKIHGVDVSSKALEVAKLNKDKLQVENVKLSQNNLLDNLNEEYDLLVANLPYVSKDNDVSKEALKEPALALFSNKNGLEIYENMFNQLSRRDDSKTVVIEAEPFQSNELKKYAKTSNFELIKQDKLLYVFKR